MDVQTGKVQDLYRTYSKTGLLVVESGGTLSMTNSAEIVSSNIQALGSTYPIVRSEGGTVNINGGVISGVGKSGIIARKVSATLSSVGVSSFYLNPGEANHGDLGQIDKRDILLVFSYSGNTRVLTSILKYANRFNIKIIGVASKPDSTLIKASDIKILIPNVKEADPTGMVPTSSTSITLLLGDCLAVALMNKIKFSKERFKVFHPGGNIGQTLLLVKDIMLSGSKIPKIWKI